MSAISLWSKWFSILVLTVFLAGCGKNDTKNSPKSKKVDTTDKQTEPEAAPSLPPNAARIMGHVQSLGDTSTSTFNISFKIKQIKGYGSSTRPLSKNQELQLEVSKQFLEKKGIHLQSGDSLHIVISQTMTLGEESGSTWRIVDFK